MIFSCDIVSDVESCRRLITIFWTTTGENLRALKTGGGGLGKVEGGRCDLHKKQQFIY